MFAIAGLIDIQLLLPVIICFCPHRYSSVVGKVLINTVFTDLKAIDPSFKIALVSSVITFVEASVSLAIKILRSEKILTV